MHSDGRILKYLTRNFPEGTKLRKCALAENGKSGNYDSKTWEIVSFWQAIHGENVGATFINWQLIIDNGQLSPGGIVSTPQGNCQLSIVYCQLKSSFPFVQDDQRGNHAGNPSAERQEENDEHGAAALVEHRKGRENDGEKYSE